MQRDPYLMSKSEAGLHALHELHGREVQTLLVTDSIIAFVVGTPRGVSTGHLSNYGERVVGVLIKAAAWRRDESSVGTVPEQ
jgi:hypothetical protein